MSGLYPRISSVSLKPHGHGGIRRIEREVHRNHMAGHSERHRIGLIEPKEYTLQQMKNEALKITREHGLTTPESVQLSVTNPRNKLSIIVDSEAVLQAQFAAHDSMEVAVFEATIANPTS
ncbi:hypothetical protein WN944_003675 [Citrus x changshan-huyou]|uniref:Uncharacterized protein n=1 Tax=Citrus x changshan-huyou TaxID=2935761 RepID=A0AAP0M216_9ROSI